MFSFSNAFLGFCFCRSIVKSADNSPNTYLAILNTGRSKHVKNEADITVVYAKHVFKEKGLGSRASTILEVNDEKRVTSALINPDILGEANRSLNMFVIDRKRLEKIVGRFAPEGFASFDRQVIQQNKANYKIYGYEHKGYYEKIEAPYKELIWFEESGHNPLIDEADKFKTLLKERLMKILKI